MSIRGARLFDTIALPHGNSLTDGSVHIATWTTKHKGGFTAQEFADLKFGDCGAGAGRGSARPALPEIVRVNGPFKLANRFRFRSVPPLA